MMSEDLDKVDVSEGEQAILNSGNRRVTLGAPRVSEAPEIKESPFPFPRVYRWVPLQEKYDVEEPSISVLITQEVLRRVNEHVRQDVKIEIGGFLLGNRYFCPNSKRNYIKIDNYSEAQFTSADDVSLHIDRMTWMQLEEELRGKYEGKQLMGWYHSHPGHTVFLSSSDVNVHDISFIEEWMVALVIDPKLNTGGFFCRRNGSLHSNAMVDFYEIKSLNSEETCMPWENHKCLDGINNEQIEPVLAANALPPPPDPPPLPPKEEPAGPIVENASSWSAYKRYSSLGIVFIVIAFIAALLFALRPWSGNDNVAVRNNAKPGATLADTNESVPAKTESPASGPQADNNAAAPSTIKPLVNDIKCKKDYDECRLRVVFDSRPNHLVATVDGNKLSATTENEPSVNSMLIDISKTQAVQAMKQLKNPDGTGDFTIIFINQDNESDTIGYKVPFKGADLLAKTKAHPMVTQQIIVKQVPVPRRRERAAANLGRQIRSSTQRIGKEEMKQSPCRGARC